MSFIVLFKEKYRFLFLAVIFIFCAGINCTNRPQTKSGITFPQVLQKAQRYYWNAEFDNALKLTGYYFNQCKKRRVRPSKRAFILLSLIYLKKDDFKRARKAVYRLLAKDFRFTPNPNDYPGNFVDLVNRVRREKSSTNSRVSKKD